MGRSPKPNGVGTNTLEKKNKDLNKATKELEAKVKNLQHTNLLGSSGNPKTACEPESKYWFPMSYANKTHFAKRKPFGRIMRRKQCILRDLLRIFVLFGPFANNVLVINGVSPLIGIRYIKN